MVRKGVACQHPFRGSGVRPNADRAVRRLATTSYSDRVRASGMPRRSKTPDPAELAGVFAQFPEVEAVYLFGSHAEGRGGREYWDFLPILRMQRAALKRRLQGG